MYVSLARSRFAPGVRKLVRVLALLLFAAATLPLLVRGLREPAHNWDALPITALALELRGVPWDEAHRRTFAAAERDLPRERFEQLVRGRSRQLLADDPARFRRVAAVQGERLGYLALVAAFQELGVPLLLAPVTVSVLSAATVLVLLLRWSSRHLGLVRAALAMAALAQMPTLRILAASSTADALGLLLVLSGLARLVETERPQSALPWLFLAQTVRPDAVLTFGLVTGGLLVIRRLRPATGAVWLVLAAVLRGLLSRQAEGYGWWQIFLYAFVARTPYPERLPEAFDVGLWLSVVRRQLDPGRTGYFGSPEVLGSTHLFVFVAAALLGLALVPASARARLVLPRMVLWALLGETALRLSLYPLLQDRFFASLHVVTPLVLISLAARAAAPVGLPPGPGRGELPQSQPVDLIR